MKKEFDKEVKKKLREEVTVPKCVDEGIQRAYDMIGISGEKKVIRRRKRIWPAAAAVAALTAGISMEDFEQFQKTLQVMCKNLSDYESKGGNS